MWYALTVPLFLSTCLLCYVTFRRAADSESDFDEEQKIGLLDEDESESVVGSESDFDDEEKIPLLQRVLY